LCKPILGRVTPDEKYMVTCAEEHTLKLWDFGSGEELWTYKNPKPELADCKISPDGKYLALATPEGKILIWRIRDLVK
jgi:WD40 repeat protein